MLNKTVSLLVGVCLFLTLSARVHANEIETVKILVLNSYHKGFHWVDGIVEAIESGLKSENYNYDLRVEYITLAIKYPKIVIPAEAGISSRIVVVLPKDPGLRRDDRDLFI